MLKRNARRALHRIRGEYTTERLVKMGMRVGSNFHRLNGAILDPTHCWLIEIGNNVTIAPRVHILAHDASTKRLLGYTRIGRVTIRDGVFIGAASVVLPHVTIGENSIIGAGSVVTKNVPPNTVYVGNPAVFVCTVEDYVKKNIAAMRTRPVYNNKHTLQGNISTEMKDEMISELADGIGFVE